ncbi:hypothetical protein FOQG_19492 [Fusarium oxysporum f. sp. raphani 54005]|uniref:Uncharacterized protein n=1 Tax=Fusarium oxysporum f. sp. raphani 54005 TaxID=1089458 RepID=X0BYY8_FUSOX|nr:hypothetical protein FOQG_19492 [Fusarium oxysporum f. sp. raphani 54005]
MVALIELSQTKTTLQCLSTRDMPFPTQGALSECTEGTRVAREGFMIELSVIGKDNSSSDNSNNRNSSDRFEQT